MLFFGGFSTALAFNIRVALPSINSNMLLSDDSLSELYLNDFTDDPAEAPRSFFLEERLSILRSELTLLSM